MGSRLLGWIITRAFYLFPKALRARPDSVAFTDRVEEMIMAVSTRNKMKSHPGGEYQLVL